MFTKLYSLTTLLTELQSGKVTKYVRHDILRFFVLVMSLIPEEELLIMVENTLINP